MPFSELNEYDAFNMVNQRYSHGISFDIRRMEVKKIENPVLSRTVFEF